MFEVKTMKVLVTGVAGQFGHDIMIEFAKRGYDGVEGKPSITSILL